MRGSLVALGLAVVVGAAAVVVPLWLDHAVAGKPVAADALVAERPSLRCDGDPELRVGGSAVASVPFTQLGDAYGQACPGKAVTYAAVGTGAGIQQFVAGETTMAATDRPLDEVELAAASRRCDVQQVPFVLQVITVQYMLPGVADLTLGAKTIAKIFSGEITRWNDPVILSQNPTALLDGPITVVGRSTDSVVTEAFQRYLAVAGGWPDEGPAFTGKATVSARTEDEVLSLIEAHEGAIGYLLTPDRTRSETLRLTGVPPNLDALSVTVELVLPDEGFELDMDKIYRAPEAYPAVIFNYAVFCTGDAGVRDYLLTALSLKQTEPTYRLPFGQWATRLREVLQ